MTTDPYPHTEREAYEADSVPCPGCGVPTPPYAPCGSLECMGIRDADPFELYGGPDDWPYMP
jgi:hypothetical protein